MLAGPTEAVVFATRGNPGFIAADLIAQAEHDPDAISIFVTTSAPLAKNVAAEIDRQLAALPKSNLARRSLAKNGAVLVAQDLASAARFVNRFAPEHLSLPGGADGLLKRIDSAGSVFLGDWSAQSFGDYASGTNHVLPTGGVARTRGGLSVSDFVKCISVQEVSRKGVRRLAPVVEEFARAEGLDAHERAVEVRK
jgi:histidinol dehydrogenase